jgi:hypothetical protein
MMAWLRKLSWKWKILVVCIGLFFFLLVFILTPWGQDTMRDKIEQYYAETPDSEKRDSPWADRYVSLAWFRGTILGQTEDSAKMFRKFLGIEDASPYTTYKLKGLCSADGKIGWGPCHPRSPEAYWYYLDQEFSETNKSNQTLGEIAWQYYTLLYDIASYDSPDHKPNPNFNLYWPKVIEVGKKSPFPRPTSIDLNAPRAPKIEQAR